MVTDSVHMNITNTNTETLNCKLGYACGGVPGPADASNEDVGRACNGYFAKLQQLL